MLIKQGGPLSAFLFIGNEAGWRNFMRNEKISGLFFAVKA